MTTGFRNLKVNGDLGKSCGLAERESLTRVGSRENGGKVIGDNEYRQVF